MAAVLTYRVSPELGIAFWEVGTYWDTVDPSAPPAAIPFHRIHCQVARGLIETCEPNLWVTTVMDRVSTCLLFLLNRST